MKHLKKSWGKRSRVLVQLILVAVMVVALLPAAFPGMGAAAEDSEAGETFQLAPVSPDFADYRENPPEEFYGYIPPPMDLSHLAEIPVQKAQTLDALPTSFDWRDTGKVTPVKNQNPCGTCWIFGTTSVLESAVLIGESVEYDFSEQSVALCMDRSWTKLYDSSTDPCHAGGWAWQASEAFMRKGAVLETCNPYNTSALNCDGTCVCDDCTPVKKVDGFRLVTDDGTQISTIKDAVYDQGPLTVAYRHSFYGEYTVDPWGAIYDYYPCSANPNHCISIIGWDDDVPHPDPDHTGTGAWIVKNSWGTADPWGDGGVSDGFFYLAYGSGCVKKEVAYLEYKDHDPAEKLVYWDEIGWLGAAGYGDSHAWVASVFSEDQPRILTHVDFWTPSNNTQYEIYVWNGFFGAELGHQTGSCQEAGYYSIPLSDPISMAAGQQFTVGAKMTTPGYGYPISIEYVDPGYADPPIQPNVSFARHGDTDSWEDLADYGYNGCLRARMVTAPENSITNIELSPPSPAALEFDEHVNVTFDYSTNAAGGVRIFLLPFTDGSPTPNFAVSGSPLYPVGSGNGSGYFTILSGAVTVDQLRFKMTNDDQSVVLLEFFIDVEHHFGHSIFNIELSPPSPAALAFNEHVNVTFDYFTYEAGGIRIFLLPFTDGSPTPNYAVSGSPLYPVGSGSGSGWFTILSGAVTVDQLRFKMTNDDQSVVLLEFFIDVQYHFGHSIFNIELSPPSPASLIFDEYVNVTFQYFTHEASGVRIFVRPYTSGSLTPNYAAHGSGVYPAGSGSGSGYFTIRSGAVTVDQLRFQMYNAGTTELLLEFLIDVEYHYAGETNIWVEPPSFDVTLPQDTTWNSTLKVGNDGEATLTYHITDVETTPGPCFKWVVQDPDPLPAGEVGVLKAKVDDPQGLADIDYVKVWVTQNPFDWTYMYDDGVPPDEFAGDGIFTVEYFGTTLYGEEFGVLLEARDLAGHSTHTSFTFHISIPEGYAAEGMLAFGSEPEERTYELTPVEADPASGAKPSGKSTVTVSYTGLIEGLDILALGTSAHTLDDAEVARLNALGANAVLVEDAAIASLTLADLQAYDVVYLALDWGRSSSYIEAIGSTIQAYVTNGGGLVVGQYNSFTLPYTPGFLPYSLTYTDTYFPDCGVTILDPTHYITGGLTGDDMPDVYDRIPIATLDATYDLLAISSVEDVLSLAVAEYGSGRIAVHTSNWTGLGTRCLDDPDIIIERIFFWTSRGALDCPWLDEDPKSGSVEPGSYDDITVTIDTTGLAPGEYCAEIWISNNDPDENPTILAVQLTVVPAPDLVIEKKWEKLATPKKYLHPKELMDPRKPIEQPVCTDWHELYPEYCNEYHLSSWEDNGDGVLSPCDHIVLTDKETKAEYHVDEMTVTILVSWPGVPENQMALEFSGGYEEVEKAIEKPVCTYWHQVWPEFCPDYHIAAWQDTGEPTGLSYSDSILLVNLETGKEMWFHVDVVTWDIVVSPVVEAETPNSYVVWYTIHNQGTATAPAGHSTTLSVDENVIEHKVVPVALRPCETYTDAFRTVIECTCPEDLIEVCADNYDQVDELKENNNCLRNVLPCPGEPSIDVEKKVWDPCTKEWVEEICAPIEGTVRFQCTIHNDGTGCDLTKIVATDTLSESLKYADNATVNGKPWEPEEVSPNVFVWKLEGFVLEPCHKIIIEFDAIVAQWSEFPDRNLQEVEAWCEETRVSDEDEAAVQPFIPGDADGDGDVDVFDLVKVKRIILEIDEPTCGADADVDCDVDVFDLVKVKRIILGIDP